MRYYTTSTFDTSVACLPETKKKQIKKAIRLAVAFFETGDLPHGLGFKSLGHQIWEICAGLSERILFCKTAEAVEVLVVGSHNDVRRYLKNL